VKVAWQRLSARFQALQKREQWMVFYGSLAAVALLGYQVLVDPYVIRHAAAMKQLAQQEQSHKEVRAKLAEVEAQTRQPAVQMQRDLDAAKQRLAQLDTQFSAVHATLVPPAQMATVVESVLKSDRGLQLLSMTTMPPSPVFSAPPAGASAERRTPAGSEAAEAAALYKHGLQITVRGGYADLNRYLERLEKLPQKMYWGRVSLAVEEYPYSRLQLTIYTISFGKSWLVI
jgi:MSHA biogenesis protein MshJ